MVWDEQKDHAPAQWSNLRAVKDVSEPMQNLAKFGRASFRWQFNFGRGRYERYEGKEKRQH
jgi:hypothetical protein